MYDYKDQLDGCTPEETLRKAVSSMPNCGWRKPRMKYENPQFRFWNYQYAMQTSHLMISLRTMVGTWFDWTS